MAANSEARRIELRGVGNQSRLGFCQSDNHERKGGVRPLSSPRVDGQMDAFVAYAQDHFRFERERFLSREPADDVDTSRRRKPFSHRALLYVKSRRCLTGRHDAANIVKSSDAG